MRRGPGHDVFGNPSICGRSSDAEHNALTALIRAENGRTPDRMVATKYQEDDPDKPIVGTCASIPRRSSGPGIRRNASRDVRRWEFPSVSDPAL